MQVASKVATKWYLTFDSNCSDCARIASAVAEKASTDLEVVSMHSFEGRELHSKHKVGQRPTLFLTSNGSERFYHGIAMMAKITSRVGPLKALRLAKAMGESRRMASATVGESESKSDRIERRHFVKALGATIGGVALALSASQKSSALRSTTCGYGATTAVGGSVYVGVPANVRDCPSLSGQICYTYTAGQNISITGRCNGGYANGNRVWFRVANNESVSNCRGGDLWISQSTTY